MIDKLRVPRRTVSVLGLVIFASLALTAVAASSASAATLHWYECSKNAEVLNSAGPSCAAGTGSEWGLRPASEVRTAEIPLYVGAGANVSWTEGGSEYRLSCLAGRSVNRLTTPKTGQATLGGGMSLTYCQVLVNGSPLYPECELASPAFIPMNSTATEFSGVPGLQAEEHSNAGNFQLNTKGSCGPFSSTFSTITIRNASFSATQTPNTHNQKFNYSAFIELGPGKGHWGTVSGSFPLVVSETEPEGGIQKFVLAP